MTKKRIRQYGNVGSDMKLLFAHQWRMLKDWCLEQHRPQTIESLHSRLHSEDSESTRQVKRMLRKKDRHYILGEIYRWAASNPQLFEGRDPTDS